MSKMLLILLAVAAVLAVKTNATEVQLCGSGAIDTTSVQISGCNVGRCELKRGSIMSITIKFTPTTTINSLTTDVTATEQGSQQPIPQLSGQNACNSILRASDNTAVKCPLEAGVQYIFKDEGTLSDRFPAGETRLHYGLKQGTTTVVCFEKDLKLV